MMLLQAFVTALQLLTRIPLSIPGYDPARQEKVAGYAVLFYPVIGLLIGALLVLVLGLLQPLWQSEAYLLHAGLLIVTWVIVTGALHLDGLADSADAWLGGFGDRERTLAIMKDPYAGPAGVTAIMVILLLKFAALSELTWTLWPALLVIPVLARLQVVSLFLTTAYVRPGGMGAAATEFLPRKTAWACLLLIAIAVIAFIDMGWMLIVGMGVVFVVLRAIMQQRLGGTTGDTAGALIEITEAALLCLIVLVRSA
ncbi:MAG: adenosylcobinamide-GDP ribazoletransferase [Thiohalophilus sp.]|uniref:adenosylcobinamide-GDP ribazoletransferase n=1 Tax=Thiohalophilus sp. TaxID=3028392 RepID=UPI0028703C0E|nr:adenosylcobinamide-GDP ribazoletransferase [Thiohalophilus sp.]MDR9437571.1 adenosylcobinamide-GDP ribazoletransferase [Thiohalophilus sp.]